MKAPRKIPPPVRDAQARASDPTASAFVSANAGSGKTHVLVTATVCAHEGAIAWRHLGSVAMTMRVLSKKDIETYLAAIGEDALTSVGAYKIEGRGIRLFEAIAGDYFTVLGLSLLPLLNFLRTVNEVEP